jgi:hypothetical protein
MSGQVADHCIDPRRPSDETVGHSAFISTRSVIPAVRRTKRTFQFVVFSKKEMDTRWSESQGYMSTKVQGDRILEEDPLPTLPPPYILSANLARVLHPS